MKFLGLIPKQHMLNTECFVQGKCHAGIIFRTANDVNHLRANRTFHEVCNESYQIHVLGSKFSLNGNMSMTHIMLLTPEMYCLESCAGE